MGHRHQAHPPPLSTVVTGGPPCGKGQLLPPTWLSYSQEIRHGVGYKGLPNLLEKRPKAVGSLDLKVPLALHFLASTVTGRRNDSSFLWYRSPIKNFCYVFCKRYRSKIICFSVILVLGIILFNFVYSAPVSANHWGQDKGTGHSCVSSESTLRFLL